MSKKLTKEEVIQCLSKFNFELISEYINSDTKIVFKDKNGYLYSQRISHLKNGHLPKIADYKNPYSIQNIKLWLKLNNKSFEFLSDKFISHKDKLLFKCTNCLEVFDLDWIHLSTRNSDCPYCLGRRIGISNCLATKNSELTSEWHPTKNGNLTPWDVTCGNNTIDVWWQCKNNPKHEWQAIINNRNIHKSGCPYCSHRHLSSEDYNLLIDNHELCKEWDYEKNDKKPEEYTPQSNQYVWWICKECEYEWFALINARNGKWKTGCPQCNESKGEKKCKDALTQYNISHGSQYTFDDLLGVGGGLLRFDIPVFWDKEKTRLRMLIEYDGKQHFEWIEGMMTKEDFIKIQIHDELKNEYCKIHNIPLLRIPYWDFDNIERILSQKLQSNTYNISQQQKAIAI